MTGTPAKLRNGRWGARVPGKPEAGQTITIRTKGGKTWEAEVQMVLWTGKGRYSGKQESLVALYDERYDAAPMHRGNGRSRFEEDEGSSFPCRVCGKFCFSGENGRCPNE